MFAFQPSKSGRGMACAGDARERVAQAESRTLGEAVGPQEVIPEMARLPKVWASAGRGSEREWGWALGSGAGLVEQLIWLPDALINSILVALVVRYDWLWILHTSCSRLLRNAACFCAKMEE